MLNKNKKQQTHKLVKLPVGRIDQLAIVVVDVIERAFCARRLGNSAVVIADVVVVVAVVVAVAVVRTFLTSPV